MSIKKMYSEGSLQKILEQAASEDLSDDGFHSFQRNHLMQVFKGFSYDLCTTSIVETDGDSGTLTVSPHLLGFEHSSEEVLANYMVFASHDTVSQIVYANPGRIFLHTDLWDGLPEEHIFFRKHCKKYGIHKSYAIGFKLIAADEFFVAFDYMAGAKNLKWYGIEPRELEYASFPFALAWLFRKKRIGKKALSDHMLALSGLTSGQLAKLRRYLNRDHLEDLAKQAESLGLKLPGYDGTLYEVRDNILAKFDFNLEALKTKGQIPLEAIEPYVILLKMMGDQTKPIVIPPGIALTKSYHLRIRTDIRAPKGAAR